MKSHRLIAASAAAALTFGGIVGGGIVLAQDSGTTPTPSTTGAPKADHQEKLDAYLTELAANLGIDVQALKDAIKTTNLSFLDKAVADGKITEEQAAEIRERIESGEGIGFGVPGFGRGDHGPKGGHGMIGRVGIASEEVASYLGMTTDELRTAIQSGKSLADIATEKGKSVDGLKDAISGDFEAKLAEKVAEGELTQSQADEMAARHDEMLDNIINGEMPALPGPKGRMHDDDEGSAMPVFPGSRMPNLPSRTIN